MTNNYRLYITAEINLTRFVLRRRSDAVVRMFLVNDLIRANSNPALFLSGILRARSIPQYLPVANNQVYLAEFMEAAPCYNLHFFKKG